MRAVGAGGGATSTSRTSSSSPQPAPRLVLVQALAKGDRDELAIEAATEVGVDVVVPWQAERSVVVWRGERAAEEPRTLDRDGADRDQAVAARADARTSSRRSTPSALVGARTRRSSRRGGVVRGAPRVARPTRSPASRCRRPVTCSSSWVPRAASATTSSDGSTGAGAVVLPARAARAAHLDRRTGRPGAARRRGSVAGADARGADEAPAGRGAVTRGAGAYVRVAAPTWRELPPPPGSGGQRESLPSCSTAARPASSRATGTRNGRAGHVVQADRVEEPDATPGRRRARRTRPGAGRGGSPGPRSTAICTRRPTPR